MEQEVATTLESLSFHVQTNRAFEDTDEPKSREIDVSAIQRMHHDPENHIDVFAELICECTNSANPFVFLMRKRYIKSTLHRRSLNPSQSSTWLCDVISNRMQSMAISMWIS
jgi:hypothetical protein